MKLVPGGPNFELSWATTAVLPYLLILAKGSSSDTIEKLKIATNVRVAAHESLLMTPLLEFLKARKDKGVRILGIEEGDGSKRASTISFVVQGKTPKDIAESFDAKNVQP